jgi:hypothetical protein
MKRTLKFIGLLSLVFFMPLLSSLPGIVEDDSAEIVLRPKLKKSAQNPKENKEKKQHKDAKDFTVIKGASYFILHGSDECYMRRGFGLRTLGSAKNKCEQHDYFTMRLQNQGTERLLIFYDRNNKEVSESVYKKGEEKDICRHATLLLDPQCKPVATWAHIHVCKNLDTVTFFDASQAFLARFAIFKVNGKEIPARDLGELQLGDHIEFAQDLKVVDERLLKLVL